MTTQSVSETIYEQVRATARVDAALVKYEILDEARVRTALRGEYLPLRGLLRLWTELVSPVDVLDGAIRLSPTDSGQPGAFDPGLALYEIIIDAIGIEPTEEESDEFLEEGRDVMEAVLLERPRTRLERFIHADEARLRAAESTGRQYLLPAAAIEEVTGRPYVSRRALLTPGQRARALREAKRDRAELEAQAQAAAAAARIEAARPRTLRESGFQCIACAKDRIAAAPEPGPMLGAPQGEDEKSLYYLVKELAGLRIPPFEAHGVSLVDGESIVPRLYSPVQDPNLALVGWIRGLRRRFAKDLDFGPVREFSDAGMGRAYSLAREHARVFVDAPPSRLWFQDHLVELLVRGLCLHPSSAVAILLEELDALHVGRHAPFAAPTRNHVRETTLANSESEELRTFARPERGRRMVDTAGAEDLPSRGRVRVVLGDLAVQAASGGDVGVGELLEQDGAPAPAPAAATTTRTKKGSR